MVGEHAPSVWLVLRNQDAATGQTIEILTDDRGIEEGHTIVCDKRGHLSQRIVGLPIGSVGLARDHLRILKLNAIAQPEFYCRCTDLAHERRLGCIEESH